MSPPLRLNFETEIMPITPSNTPARSNVLTPHIRENNLQVQTPIFRIPKHIWTIEEQIILCVLERWFVSCEAVGKRALSYSDMRSTFCAYFAKSIRFRGTTKHITSNAINAQLYQIKREGRKNDAWREVFLETDFSDIEGHWSATKSELVAAATEVGVALINKSSELTAEVLAEAGSSCGERKRDLCPRRPRPWTNEACIVNVEDKTEDYRLTHENPMLITPTSTKTSTPGDIVLTSTKSTSKGSRSKIHKDWIAFPLNPSTTPSGKATTRIKDTTTRTMKTDSNLVFRFFDSDSQGVNSPNGFFAGTFVACEATDLVPSLYTEKYLRPAESHLKRFHESSPFISVYDSLLPALHRGLRSSANAKVSIIDVHNLIVDGNNEHSRILWVPDIVRELRKRGRYTELDYFGQTEWLIWKKVPASSIVATLSMDILRDYAKRHPAIDRVFCLTGIEGSKNWYQYRAKIKATIVNTGFSAGHVIGLTMGLWGLPRAHLDTMALQIAHVWRFCGTDNQQKREEYFNGVRTGYAEFFCRGHTNTARRCLDECEKLKVEDGDDLDNDLDDDLDDASFNERHDTEVGRCQNEREKVEGASELEQATNGVEDLELAERSQEYDTASNESIQDVFAARRSEIISILRAYENKLGSTQRRKRSTVTMKDDHSTNDEDWRPFRNRKRAKTSKWTQHGV